MKFKQLIKERVKTMDISNLCRSCMKEVASWEKENFDARAVEMFCYCTNIKVLKEEIIIHTYVFKKNYHYSYIPCESESK